MRKQVMGGLVAGALVCFSSSWGGLTSSWADDLGSYSELPDVGDRNDSPGIHLYPFWILPSVETGVYYDSNSDEQPHGSGSAGAYIAPHISAKSDFGRHALDFNLGAQHYEYFEDDTNARTNFFGDAQTRLDIRRDLILTSGIRGGFFENDITGDEKTPLGAAELVPYRDLEGWSRLSKVFNRLAVSVDGRHYVADYDDVDMIGGGVLDQDFRDHHENEVGGRVGYLISPGYSIFVDGHANDRNYDTGGDDSTGWRALGGVEFEVTRLLRGEIGAGYMTQNYDTGPTVSDVSYHLGLIWNPTMFMTVRLDGDRQVSESDVADSPGTVETSINAAVAYEVLRSLVVTPSAGVSFDDYIASPLESRSLHAGLDADYLVNRFLSVGFDYRFEDVDYAGGGADYDRHIVGVNAKAHF
jgi:hypothetical protein